mmetsp:Transcript_28790/g.66877  ORF Transcript_28790/g.66877 Transcript_28790/m.66877 type:complete len:346 (-) Transcript_28790:115-1152(-)
MDDLAGLDLLHVCPSSVLVACRLILNSARAAELEAERLTQEQEEEVRRLFLMERMASYTIAVRAEDILNKKQPNENKEEHQAPEGDIETPVMERQGEGDLELGDSGEDPKSPLEKKGEAKANDCDEDEPHQEDADPEAGEASVLTDNMLHETHSSLLLPAAGTSLACSGSSFREVPNCCAICLAEFEVDERVTWASNADCPHAFHEDCVLKWMLSVGRKRGLRRGLDDNRDSVEVATDFPMLCPCCRQVFISRPNRSMRITETESTMSFTTEDYQTTGAEGASMASPSTDEENVIAEEESVSTRSASMTVQDDHEAFTSSEEDPASTSIPTTTSPSHSDTTRPPP